MRDNKPKTTRDPVTTPKTRADGIADAPSVASPRRRWMSYLPLVVLAIAMGAAYALDLPQKLTLEAFVEKRDTVKALVEANHALSLAVYALAYVAVVALSLPGGLIMTIIGGFLFGWLLGGTMALASATLGATLVFFVARSSLGATLIERAGPRLNKVAEGLRENAASYLLFLRLVPVFPFWLVNLAAALFNVELRVFIATTALGILPGTFAFAFAGAGLDSVIAAQQDAYTACMAAGTSPCNLKFHPRALLTRELMIAFVALGLVALIPIGIKLWRQRRAKAIDDGRDVA